MPFRKHWSLLTSSIRLETMDRMEDAVAFSMISIGTLIRMAVMIIFFEAVYLRVDTLGGWPVEQMYVLLGTYFIIHGVAWATYVRGLNKVARYIELGDLDVYLTKPVNLQIFLSYRFIDVIFSTPQIIGGVALVAYGVVNSGVAFNLPFYLLALLLAFLINYSLVLILAAINFYYLNRQSVWLREEILELGRYPTTIYKGATKFVLTYVFPVLIIFSFPAMAFFGQVTLAETIAAVGITVVIFYISQSLWNRGLNRYESAKG